MIKYLHIILLVIGIFIVNLFPSFFLISGTYFLLDTSFVPFNQFKGFLYVSYYESVINSLNFIFGYALFSKLYFLITMFTGVTVGIMISRYIGKLFPKYQGRTLDIIAIITGIYNPFINERIISQTGIALGSYLLIIGMILLSSNRQELKWMKTISISLFFGVAWMIFPHAILLITLVLGIFSLLYFKNILKYIIVFIGVVILNLNWLIGGLIAPDTGRISSIETFDRTNIEVFQGNSLSGLGIDITHLLGYGFWGEKYHIVSPDDIIPFWFVFGFMVLGIVVYGGYCLYSRDKKLFFTLSSIALIAYILSMGIASPMWGWLSELLYTHIPFYVGMRESQKWLALTQGIYMFMFVIGSMSIVSYLSSRYKLQYSVIISLCILPILWAPVSVIGYWGQLNISDYPNDVFTAKAFLDESIEQDKQILNFPWHSYMACEWTYGKVTANRTKDIFYPHNIISSDNIEIGNLYTNSSSIQSQDIEKYLQTKDISLLEKNGISYLLLLKTCADRKNYTYIIDDSESYKPIFKSEHIDIYQIHYEK